MAERVAAGEVVERPASVVRELVDNALDAAAREISVEVRGGGLELIRVGDDGWGIPPDEVDLAFQRHATSKIRSVDDLFQLRTLGFRGEALPSIAAVAEVSLLTRVEGETSATLLALRGGEVVRRGRQARQRGTTVSVRHLFHNVPARLAFLPASRHEALLIGHMLRRYALAHPDRRFSLLLDGRLSFRSSGSGRLETALAEVYGPAVAAALLPLRADPSAVEGVALRGYLSGRSTTRPGRQHITFVVNGRLTASRGLPAALEAAYRPFLPRGRHPIAVVVLDVPPAEVDPNVHPAKSEIKLLREPLVAEALARAVRETLGRTPERPDDRAAFALGPDQPPLPTPRRGVAEPAAGWGDEAAPLSPAALGALRVLAQVQHSLILAEGPGGLYLVDQHRAHERIIFESLPRRSAGLPAEGQTLLEPVLLELKPHQAALLEERLADLEALGFVCQRFGGRDFLLRAVPALPASGADLAADLQALLEEAAAEDEGWRERLMASLACRAAVRRNRPLDEPEMRTLLAGLAAAEAPAACPHGSPLILHLSGRFFQRQFRW